MQRSSIQPLEGNVVLRYRGQEGDKVRSAACHWPFYPYYCPLPCVCLHPFLSHCQKKSKAKKNPTLAVLLGCEIFTKLLREKSAWEKWLIAMPEPVLSRQTTAVTAITNVKLFFLQSVLFPPPARQFSALLIPQANRAQTFLPWHSAAIAKATLKLISPSCYFSAIMVYRQMET